MFASYHVRLSGWTHIFTCLNVKEPVARSKCHNWRLSDCNKTRSPYDLFRKQKLNHLAKLAKCWAVLCVVICTVHLFVCSYHVRYAFQSESTVYGSVSVKELLAQSRRQIWRLNDCNETRSHNCFVCKRTVKHLAKLVKWLRCVVSTSPGSAFVSMFLSCQVCVSDLMHTL